MIDKKLYLQAKAERDKLYAQANATNIKDLSFLGYYVEEIKRDKNKSINKNYMKDFKTGKTTFVIQIVMEEFNTDMNNAIEMITGINPKNFFEMAKKQTKEKEKQKELSEEEKQKNFLEKVKELKANNTKYQENVIVINKKEEEEKQKDFKIEDIMYKEDFYKIHVDPRQKNYYQKLEFYLQNTRGIDNKILHFLIDNKLLATTKFGLPIFLYKDINGKIIGGQTKYFLTKEEKDYNKKVKPLKELLKNTDDESKIKEIKNKINDIKQPKKTSRVLKDSTGTFNFVIGNTVKKVYVFESIVDLLSFITIYKNNSKVINNSLFISTNGALILNYTYSFIDHYKDTIKCVYTCQDNDMVGNEAAEKIENNYKDILLVKRLCCNADCKDWSEQLMKSKNLNLDFNK